MRAFSSAIALALAAGLRLGAAPADPMPSPDLLPEEVVRIQVEALQHNDAPTPDAGIATAFRFASPGNRAATGPLERFTQMVRLGYADLLDFDEATYGPIQVVDDRAVQAVGLTRPDGRRTTYVFGLSRQTEGACAGCWMTDGVVEQAGAANGIRRI